MNTEKLEPEFKVGDWIIRKDPYEGEQERFVGKVDMDAMEYLLYPYFEQNFTLGGEYVAIKDQKYYEKAD